MDTGAGSSVTGVWSFMETKVRKKRRSVKKKASVWDDAIIVIGVWSRLVSREENSLLNILYICPINTKRNNPLKLITLIDR